MHARARLPLCNSFIPIHNRSFVTTQRHRESRRNRSRARAPTSASPRAKDDVHARIRLDHTAHLPHRERVRRLLERALHRASRELSQVSASLRARRGSVSPRVLRPSLHALVARAHVRTLAEEQSLTRRATSSNVTSPATMRSRYANNSSTAADFVFRVISRPSGSRHDAGRRDDMCFTNTCDARAVSPPSMVTNDACDASFVTGTFVRARHS